MRLPRREPHYAHPCSTIKRPPAMPAKPTWLLKLPKIRDELAKLKVPVVDRACFERVFGVRRRRAIQLMHRFGGFQSGRTFLIDRGALLEALARLSRGDYEYELERRMRLVAELEKARKLAPGRKVKVPVPASVMEHKLADLPGGIHLEPGELRIEFHGTEDLLRQMFELSQAILNDYKKFEEMCEGSFKTGQR